MIRTQTQTSSLSFSRYWWIPLISGLLFFVFGIWTLCCPGESLEVLAYAFAIIFTIAGLFYIFFAAAASRWSSDWGWNLAIGILEVILGIWLLTLPAPQLTVAFMFIAGFWLLFAAINSVCESFAVSAGSFGWTMVSVLFLIATIIFAVIFLSNPIVGGIAVWLWLGLSLLCYGVFKIVVAFKLRSLGCITDGMLYCNLL